MANRQPSEAELKEHRRIMRELRGQGQAALTWGLPNPTTEASLLGMGLVMRDKLADTQGADRATAAAGLAEAMLDRTIQTMPQAKSYACAKGCNYCCHSTVAVSAPEAFRIVRAVEGRTAEERRAVVARATARAAITFETLITLRSPCALLEQGDCSIYEARPMGCRQFVSTNLHGCRTSFEQKTGDFPFVPAAANAGLILRSLLISATASIGLKPELYDMSTAVAVALSEPDAEQRWLAGEDVLAKAVKMPPPPQMSQSVQRWSKMLADLFV